MKFIDEAKIDVTAGHGGKGCVSFRREKYVPRGGPNGGNGGKGGDVIFVATHDLSTLMDFQYKRKIIAKDGEHGMGSDCDGHAADDVVVPVPVGTVVHDAESGDVLFDFIENGQKAVIAKGGRGGKGNLYFVSSTNQSPMHAQEGEDGEHKKIRLELKLLADVGLVGFPNAGKSTFLSSVSRAHPKIADYPFTTLSPCLGVVQYKDAKAFVIADLPGLIEGAHEGKGMGLEFLRHAERTRVLLHLVSLSPVETIDPVKRFDMIEKELKQYSKAEMKLHPEIKIKDLSKKKKIILLTQCDLVVEKELAAIVKDFKKHTKTKIITISSATRKNLEEVLAELSKLLSISAK